MQLVQDNILEKISEQDVQIAPKAITHKTVMLKETIDFLQPKAGKTFLDVTFGGGGHSKGLLAADPNCKVIGLDWDKATLDAQRDALQEEFGPRLQLFWGNFAQLYSLSRKHKWPLFDGIIADFGTSQHQIFNTPGLSFQTDTPLDMRLSKSHGRLTAEEIVNTYSAQALAKIFWNYGQERYGYQIAQQIVFARTKKPISGTLQLAELVAKTIYKSSAGRFNRNIHPATQVFQALRIVVNGELDNIAHFLPSALALCKPGATMVCISFHSLEDELVKEFVTTQTHLGTITPLHKRMLCASQEEIEANPSSRSARLRAFSKL